MKYSLESIEDSLQVYFKAQARSHNEPEQWALDQQWLISELKAAQTETRKLEKVRIWLGDGGSQLTVGEWGKLHDILSKK